MRGFPDSVRDLPDIGLSHPAAVHGTRRPRSRELRVCITRIIIDLQMRKAQTGTDLSCQCGLPATDLPSHDKARFRGQLSQDRLYRPLRCDVYPVVLFRSARALYRELHAVVCTGTKVRDSPGCQGFENQPPTGANSAKPAIRRLPC